MILWSVLFANKMQGISRAFLRANKTQSENLLTVLNNDWHLENKIQRNCRNIFTLLGLSIMGLED